MKFLYLFFCFLLILSVAEGNTQDRKLGINTDIIMASSLYTPYVAIGGHTTSANNEFNITYGQNLDKIRILGLRASFKSVKAGYKRNFTRVLGVSWLDVVFSGNISYTNSKHNLDDVGYNYLTTSGLLGFQFHLTDFISVNLFPAGVAYSAVLDQGKGHIMQRDESTFFMPRVKAGFKFNFYRWD